MSFKNFSSPGHLLNKKGGVSSQYLLQTMQKQSA